MQPPTRSDGVLRDFTTDARVVVLALMATFVGALSAVVAYALLRLIGLITNVAFFGRWSTSLVSPASNHLGGWVLVVPVVGALGVGMMARYGSEKIRGHGIPEAMEAILIGQSKIEPKVAVLKPVSSAISIGTGGPFGAEGPIIMTGGAFGSLFGQLFHLSAGERKTLLVAGAAGGMSATFGTPVAAVLLAVELLLFEWKPRSFIPVAASSAVAAALRPSLLGSGALFPVKLHASLPWDGLLICVAVGVGAGIASSLVSALVYWFEDLFRKLPIHWMWWPAIGGLCIGIGGLIEPHALGVGYGDIHRLVTGRLVGTVLIGLVIVKAVIWSFSLGSGTSGGVLAPLLMIGGALGALEAHLIPVGGSGFWALISMGAVLAGTLGAPLTAIVFVVEVTRALNALLPLLIACTASFGVTVLFMRRSILTEKVARRGHHVMREYVVDPFEVQRVADVMTRDVDTVAADAPLGEVTKLLTPPVAGGSRPRHPAYPVVDDDRRVVGIVTRGDLMEWTVTGVDPDLRVGDAITDPPIVGYPDEPVGRLADRMALAHIGRAPIVSRHGTLVGIVSRTDLLNARTHRINEEVDRRRLIRLRQRREARQRVGTTP